MPAVARAASIRSSQKSGENARASHAAIAKEAEEIVRRNSERSDPTEAEEDVNGNVEKGPSELSVRVRQTVMDRCGSVVIQKFTVDKNHSKLMGDITNLPPYQRRAVEIVELHAVDCAVGLVIFLNLCLLILETDAQASDGSAPSWIEALNYILMFVYISEASFKLFAYRRAFFTCGWNVLDFVVVSTDFLLFFLDVVWANMPKVSVLRVFRLLRLMRAFKALSMFPELAMLLRSFMCAIKAIFWGVMLILMVITIWSILAVQLIHPLNQDVAKLGVYTGCDRCPQAFASVFDSNLTIFQTIVAGDSWGQVSLPIIQNAPMSFVFFLLVQVTVGTAIMNLILAVIVDSSQSQKEESLQEIIQKKEAEFEEAAEHLLKLCSMLDTDKSGCLAKDEILAGFEMPEFRITMQAMNLEHDDMSAIFDVLDDDGSGDVSYKELVKQLFRFRSPDLRTAIFELTRLHQKVQILFKHETQKNHESLMEVAQATHEHMVRCSSMPSAASQTLGLAANGEQPGEPEVTVEVVETRAPALGGDPTPVSIAINGDALDSQRSLLEALQERLQQQLADLRGEVRKLVENSEANQKLLINLRSSFDGYYPSRWEGIGISSVPNSHEPSPQVSFREPWPDTSRGLRVHAADLLRQDPEKLPRSRASDPSSWTSRCPATSIMIIPEERAPPPKDARRFGGCCTPQPELRIPVSSGGTQGGD